jgi:Uma2 family endonuclease
MVSVAVVVDDLQVDVPDWVEGVGSFLHWAETDAFPPSGRVCYLKDRVWVDMTLQEMNHNQLKGVFGVVIGQLLSTLKLGRYFYDRMLLCNRPAKLATEPDGMFVSHESLRIGRVRLVGTGRSPVRVEGSPDMALAVVSPGSVQKDTVELGSLYWDAEVREYWLVDPLGERLAFDILRHTARGYVATRKQAGWLKSAVLGKSFRLTQQAGADGYPEYTLAVR